MISLSRNITLFWHQHNNNTIGSKNNRLTYSAPGANKFKAFLAGIPIQEEARVFKMCFIMPDASFQPHNPVKPNKELREPSNKAERQQNSQTWKKKNKTQNSHSSTPDMDTKFVLDNIKRIHEIETNPEPTTLMPKDELLRWHYKLGHLSFKRLKSMAEHGISQGSWHLSQTIVSHTSIWQADKATMANQRDANPTGTNGHKTRTDPLSGSIEWQDSLHN